MKRKLIGISLVVISLLSAGYMLGGVVNAYLPNILVKVCLFLVMLSSGIYLVVKNRRYFSDVL